MTNLIFISSYMCPPCHAPHAGCSYTSTIYQVNEIHMPSSDPPSTSGPTSETQPDLGSDKDLDAPLIDTFPPFGDSLDRPVAVLGTFPSSQPSDEENSPRKRLFVDDSTQLVTEPSHQDSSSSPFMSPKDDLPRLEDIESSCDEA